MAATKTSTTYPIDSTQTDTVGLQKKAIAQAVSCALVAGAAAAPLQAQELEEIVVTATKRAESVMDVPLAITAMSGQPPGFTRSLWKMAII